MFSDISSEEIARIHKETVEFRQSTGRALLDHGRDILEPELKLWQGRVADIGLAYEGIVGEPPQPGDRLYDVAVQQEKLADQKLEACINAIRILLADSFVASDS